MIKKIVEYFQYIQNRRKLLRVGFAGPFYLQDQETALRLSKRIQKDISSHKNYHVKDVDALNLFKDPFLTDSIKTYFGKGYNLWRSNFFIKNKDKSAKIGWHHDKHFQNHESQIDFNEIGDHVSILIALNAMNKNNGLFQLIPGSHIGNEASRDKRMFQEKEGDEHFIKLAHAELKNIREIELQQGQFILFHSALIHGSTEYLSGNVRVAMTGRLAKKRINFPENLDVEALGVVVPIV